MLAQNSLQGHFQPYVILIQICVKLLSPQYFSDLFQLIVVICALEERFPVEDLPLKKKYHTSHHHTQ